MHDTAFRIGCLAMDIYADVEAAWILELGSANVNGSLRDHATPSTRYVGIDLEAGNGVDIVVAPGEPLPVEDGTFDLVMASSVFEHDPAFWITFLEMCRKAKPGGYVYINAPSNGAVHRYPEDHWRFYPDSALALVRWAHSQGEQVALVESFIAGRESDIWNDFVAIFRKDAIGNAPAKQFVHDQVPSCNVRTWESGEVLRQQDLPEDITLLRQAKERLAETDAWVFRLADDRRTAEIATAQTKEQLVQAQKTLAQAEVRLQADAALQVEVERWRKTAEQRDGELSEAKQSLADASEALVAVGDRLDERFDEIVILTAMVLERDESGEGGSAETRRQLDERFKEIALLSGFLREQEQSAKVAEDNARWLRDVHLVLSVCPRWWGFMPRRWQERKRDARTKRKGLFDGRAYLDRYPDVEREGLNPLRHYIQHGQAEGRLR
jgi:SAM-dependent methyltransferase